MRRAKANRRGSAAIQGERRPSRLIIGVTSTLLAVVAPCVGSRAQAADDGSGPTHRMVLTPENLDRVTAGSLTIQINADAAAHGTTTSADALARFETRYGEALMVHVDPPPNPSPPQLMGTQELAITRGNGRAQAFGDQGADCSVVATVLSPDLVAGVMSSDKVATATTALCQCSFLTVSIAR